METLILMFVMVMLVAAAGYILSVSWRDFTRHLVSRGDYRGGRREKQRIDS